MVTCMYSVKGGAGATTFAAIVAIALSRTTKTLAIDLCGDLPLAFGVGPTPSEGIYDWLTHREQSPTDPGEVRAVETALGEYLSIVSIGNKSRWCSTVDPDATQEWYTQVATSLLSAASADGRHVIVDAGTLPIAETFVECWAPSARLRWELALRSQQRILVTRACYLGLQAAAALPVPPTEIAFVRETGRALSRRDVEGALDAEIRVEVDADVSIARAVDAGLLTSRLPKSLRNTVGRVVSHA